MIAVVTHSPLYPVYLSSVPACVLLSPYCPVSEPVFLLHRSGDRITDQARGAARLDTRPTDRVHYSKWVEGEMQ
jgi:hypothetical protein